MHILYFVIIKKSTVYDKINDRFLTEDFKFNKVISVTFFQVWFQLTSWSLNKHQQLQWDVNIWRLLIEYQLNYWEFETCITCTYTLQLLNEINNAKGKKVQAGHKPIDIRYKNKI